MICQISHQTSDLSSKDVTALIDGDSFLYRAGFAVEKTKYLVEDGTGNNVVFPNNAKAAKALESERPTVIWTRKELGTLADATAILDGMINRALGAIGAKNHFVYISASVGNFRDVVATIKRYKGNRDGLSRPVYYSDLRDYLVSTHYAIVTRGEEADDQLSWVARQVFRDQKRPYVIVGIDKDLKQIPGDHYDWVEEKAETITEDEARINFWSQTLSGDPGDNIGGVWGLGPKKASNFIVQCNALSDEEMWPKIVRKYKESQKIADCPYKDLDAETVALETARLVRLRQTNEDVLWTPRKGKAKDNAEEKE